MSSALVVLTRVSYWSSLVNSEDFPKEFICLQLSSTAFWESINTNRALVEEHSIQKLLTFVAPRGISDEVMPQSGFVVGKLKKGAF